jgi:hypothetical protein
LLACLLAWLVGWLVGWLVDWLVGWLVGWLVNQSVSQSVSQSLLLNLICLHNTPFALEPKLYIFFFLRLLQSTVRLGWILSVAALLFAVFGVFPFQQPEYEYNATWSALYSRSYRADCALGVGWIFLACESNHGDT